MSPSNRYENTIKEEDNKHYCTNCGKLLSPNWNVCPFCGFKVRKDLWKEKSGFEDNIKQIEKKDEISTLIRPEIPILKEKREVPKPIKNLCPFCGYENELDKTYCSQCGYIFKIL